MSDKYVIILFFFINLALNHVILNHGEYNLIKTVIQHLKMLNRNK